MGYNQGAEGHLFKPKKSKDWFTLVMFVLGIICLISGPIFTGLNLLATGIPLAVFGFIFFTLSIFIILLGKYIKPLWLLLGILVAGIGCLVAGFVIMQDGTIPLSTMLIIYGIVGLAVPLIAGLVIAAIK